jgi:putative membrane protein
MGFGFVVARFGLFLRAVAGPAASPPRLGLSLGLGVAMVVLGVGVTLLAAAEYRTVLRRIDRGEDYVPPRWSLGLVVAAALAALGAVMAAYLLAVDH